MFIILVNAIFLFIISLLCILYIFYVKLTDNLAKKIQENEKLQRLQIESKLAVLQAKINPHFLFNTLNTMMDMVQEHPSKVETMIFNLSNIYRKALTWPDIGLVRLEEELEFVRQYLEIEKNRMGDRLRFRITVPKALSNASLPPMLIQPLVENAIRHGLEPKVGGGEIHIRVDQKESVLQVEVADTGLGLQENEASGSSLTNIRQRLHSLFGDQSRLILEENQPRGFKAIIEVPYESNQGHYRR